VNSVLRAYLLSGVKWKTGYEAVLQVAAHTTTYEGSSSSSFRPRRARRVRQIRPLVLFGELDRQRTARYRNSLPKTPSFSRTEASIEPGTVHEASPNTSAATANRRNAAAGPIE
jgi:hypothetical protein